MGRHSQAKQERKQDLGRAGKDRPHSLASYLTAPFFIIILVVLLVAIITVFVSQQRSYREHLARHSELQKELAVAEKEKESLSARLEDVDSDEYAEQVARDELGMVRPGEIVFESPGSRPAETVEDSSPDLN